MPRQRDPLNRRSRGEHKERVKHLANLMAAAQYVPRITEQQLCTEWGCSPSAFAKYAAEASRVLEQSVEDDTGLRARLEAALQFAIQRMVQTGEELRRIARPRLGDETPEQFKRSILEAFTEAIPRDVTTLNRLEQIRLLERVLDRIPLDDRGARTAALRGHVEALRAMADVAKSVAMLTGVAAPQKHQHEHEHRVTLAEAEALAATMAANSDDSETEWEDYQAGAPKTRALAS